jgi:hypothetical protein
MRTVPALVFLLLLGGAAPARAQCYDPCGGGYAPAPARYSGGGYPGGGYDRQPPQRMAPLWLLTIDPRTGSLRGIPIPWEELEERSMPRAGPSFEGTRGNGGYRPRPRPGPACESPYDRPPPRVRIRTVYEDCR